FQHYESTHLIPTGSWRIWDGDFEQSNFGVDRVLVKTNSVLKKGGYQTIRANELREVMEKNHNLMWSLNHLVKRQNSLDLSDLISKKALTRQLLARRLNGIRREKLGPGWKPQLPFEQFLNDSVLGKLRIYGS